ncbi:MAG: leucine--tRNA ligase [Candidatus Blackburnbacteria bacterium RIFCSPHIGHO2_12_FULL_41_13b]|uniref:Leucine--tRNA ligase n=1 Tax=Candidatus Blackburnbacteria bacterium RIFCSPHIGHO2_12_FULL_41_13b TaxID=1797517 RepID=A0A1G1V7J7_9BACT|nr:MAG: leucine--tRNA ligase [Candidatus Blackburnbacteria bacterium RIFCSPHIGHO2_12_FULL_41_13b]
MSKTDYNPAVIEAKWQSVWQKQKLFSPDLGKSKKPYYNLMMFPYPSAEGLHAGNMYAFTGADIWGRYQRMRGNDVFEPMGLDGFGIHSENYAIKINEHPTEVSKRTEERFYTQLQATGNAFDWTRTLETYDPDYYRWTQWIFIQMFKHGLAFRKKAKVNWCPSCLTVLADEQVISGECERCKSVVEQRDLEQWFFKITDYADRLLNNLEKINWTEKIKIAQRNWIGRSYGAEVKFKVVSREAKQPTTDTLTCFTTRPDTLYGTTFMVIAPDSPLVVTLTAEAQKEVVSDYIKEQQNISAQNLGSQGETLRSQNQNKTGVFTGACVVNPANNKDIPVYISNYVVSGYGSEAVMGVPAHDQRDFEMARKYNLDIVSTIKPEKEADQDLQEAYVGEGTIINSGDWNGLSWPRDREKILSSLEENGWGKKMTTYHLRDWLISRQRYWGPPIPMIYCQACADKGDSGIKNSAEWNSAGWFPVPEDQLPVKLPYVENYRPTGTGKSPLSQDEKFINVKCPKCGEEARRETDVSDTFLDSAWYYLRYPSVGNQKSKIKNQNEMENAKMEKLPWDPEITRRWLPVDMYIGGAEHSVLHLMYSRFVTMALHDWGYLDFEEPFTRFFAHGLLIREGAKMSKSKGNVIVPDAYIKKYGADTLRLYLMFLAPFNQGGDFRDTGMEGMFKFVRRVWNLAQTHPVTRSSHPSEERLIHKAIKRVTEDLEGLHYNRAISGIMEYVNELEQRTKNKEQISREAGETLLKLFAPFAPHMTEELWHRLGNKNSIHFAPWPVYNEALVKDDLIQIPIQVNGKYRGVVVVSADEANNQKTVEERARSLESAAKYLTNEPKKVIFVPGKTINFVVT